MKPRYQCQLSPPEARQLSCCSGLAGSAEAPSHGQGAEHCPQAAASSAEDNTEPSGTVICERA